MAKKKLTPYEQGIREEHRKRTAILKQEMLYLTRKVARNKLATDYYIQLKELLEELLMLDLAQKAVEATMKFETRNKVISIDDSSLLQFRTEMEKAKTLKLVSGILSATGHFEVDRVLEKIESLLYAPSQKSDSSKADDTISRLKKLLDTYAKKMEILSKRNGV